MKWIRNYVVLFIVSCFVCINVFSENSIIINHYQVQSLQSAHTQLDTIFDSFQSYFGTVQNGFFTIEKPYDATSYRLDKRIITLVRYSNVSDSVIQLKFYATLNRYSDVGEFQSVNSYKIKLEKSNYITCNKQFFELSILPKSTLNAYLIHQPISFKDYFVNKNQVFNYNNTYLFPEFSDNTYKEDIGFSSLMLFLLGMVFILFVFYGLAYINLKDRIYLSYTLYLFVTFFQVLYMAQYIFAKNMMMFNIIGSSCFDECTKGLMIVFYSIFYKQAFEIRKEQKFLYYSVESLKIISLVYVIVIVMSYTFELNWYNEPFLYTVYRFPIFLFSLIVLYYSVKLKDKTAFQKMILFGSLIYTVFTIFTTFQKTDFPVKDLLVSINGLYLGVALELVVFSIALGLRIRDSYLATEKLQDKLIFELQQNEEFIRNENTILENRVKDRIFEINKQNLLIEEQNKQALLQQFEKEKVEIQMQALSSQMNPHFIFNCMNSIQHSIITNDTEKASTMLHDFASLIRMVLENSSLPDITLDNEIKLIETYLKLEQVRTNNSFNYNIQVSKDIVTDFVKIPTMMLQPFLENAIWHGFKFINYKGNICVNFTIKDHKIYCEVIDNGIGVEKAKELNANHSVRKSMAIQIIKNRIHLINQTLTDNKASISIIDLKDKQHNSIGTKVIIELPIL